MNTLRLHILRQQEGYYRFLYGILSNQKFLPVLCYTTEVDAIDAFTNEMLHKHRNRVQNGLTIPNICAQQLTEKNSLKDVSSMSDDELDMTLQQLQQKNKDKQITQVINYCLEERRLLSDKVIKNLLKDYASLGKPEMVLTIQKYMSKVLPNSYKRNGEFSHYYAKAQCLRGNSDKGLSVLKEAYKKNQNLRSFYRVILRDLIHDSVMNRSEASLVVFKKYVLEFSDEWDEHYPLVCLWHICWSSSWYSDQVLADDLWQSSEELRGILQNKVAALSISALKSNYNEDAVIRLLQILLKHQMMAEYTSVLQILFDYKLKNKDLRGCTEIIRNCEVLGLNLTSDQQGRYIKMLIVGKPRELNKPKPASKEFKLKF